MAKRQISRLIALFVLLIIGMLRLAPLASGHSDATELDSVWQRVERSGAYRFTADVTQTSTPLATVANAGRTSREQQLSIVGEANLPSNAMTLHLWTGGGSVLDPNSGIEIQVAGDEARGRQANGAWEEVEGFTGIFAPGGDLMAYTQAAENVVNQGTEVRRTPLGDVSVTRYTFDINGRLLAKRMRAQMMEQAAIDGLPATARVELPRAYAEMSGTGELWVGADGLPLRQRFELSFPPDAHDIAASAVLTVDFSDFAPVTAMSLSYRVGSGLAAIWQALTAPKTLATWPMLGLGFLFVATIITRRRSRWVYASVATLVIVSMLAVPLITNRKVYAYSVDQAVKQARNESLQAEADARRAAQTSAQDAQMDPNLSPLAAADLKSLADDTSGRYHDSRCLSAPNGDIDQDLLTNLQECLLGTLLDVADSDGDGASDYHEVTGVEYRDVMWYTDPLLPDSNNDGIPDGKEWFLDPNNDGSPDLDTDGDGRPDLWDDDNDGDGVPDNLDLSPYVSTFAGSTTPKTFSDNAPLELTLNQLMPNELVKVEFQLVPTNGEHLWYSQNILDWPSGDFQGNIQDADGKTFYDVDPSTSFVPNANGDMRMVPLLEIRFENDNANLPPAKTCTDDDGNPFPCFPLLQDFGVSVTKLDDNTSVAYVPLQLVSDPNGDEHVAFYGRMFYQASGSWTTPHEARLTWAVQMLNDVCAEYADGHCTKYDSYNELQVVHTYYDDWQLTGLHLTEEHSADMALVYEDPAATPTLPTGDEKPLYLDVLYSMMYGLDKSFLAGRCTPTDAQGACTADSTRDFTVDDIYTRFNHATNDAVSDVDRWNLPNVLSVEKNEYAALDVGMWDTTITQTVGILNNNFTPAWSESDPITPTIMLAYEQTYRDLNLDVGLAGNNANLSWTGNGLTLDLPQSGDSAIELDTMVAAKWTPYAYDPATGWVAADIENFWTTLDKLWGPSFDDGQGDDQRTQTYLTLAEYQYMNMYTGVNSVVQMGDVVLPSPYQQADSSVAEEIGTGTVKLALKVATLYFKYSESLAEIATYLRDAGETEYVTAKAVGEFISQKVLKLSTTLGKIGFTVAVVAGVILLITVIVLYFVAKSVHNTGLNWSLAIGAGLLMTAFTLVGPIFDYLPLLNKLVTTAAEAGEAISYGTAVYRTLTEASSITTGAEVLGVLGLLLAIGIAIGYFIAAWANGSAKPGSFAFNEAAAFTVATIVVAVVFFLLSLTPLGGIIVGIIAIIDLVAYLAGLNWSITGTITKALASAIYRVDLYAKASQNTGALDQSLEYPALGLVSTNAFSFTLPITTTLTPEHGSETLRKNSLVYELAGEARDLSTTREARYDDWIVTEVNAGNIIIETKAVVRDAPTTHVSLAVGVNARQPLYLNTAWSLGAQSCWTFVCSDETISGNAQTSLGTEMIYDVLPGTLDELVNTGPDGWAKGAVRAVDTDGDGLLAAHYGGLDPDDTTWDKDGDSLSDAYELALRGKPTSAGGMDLDPLNADTDGDLLDDGTEVRYGTDPDAPDSDGDGLPDIEEMPYVVDVSGAVVAGGWDYYYAPDKKTRVWGDPLSSDIDGDGLSDRFERAEDTCPTCRPWQDPDNPLLFHPHVWTISPVSVYIGDGSNRGFVAPGATIPYTTTTVNNLGDEQELSGRLSLILPNGFTLSGGSLAQDIDITNGQQQSLQSTITAANTSTPLTGTLSSTMNATDFASTTWQWDTPLTDDAAFSAQVTALQAVSVRGWRQPTLVVTTEVDDSDTQRIVGYLADSVGNFTESQTLFSTSSGETLTAPSVACNTSGVCLVAFGMNPVAGTGEVIRIYLDKQLAEQSAYQNVLSSPSGTRYQAPAVASNGTDFMIAGATADGATGFVRYLNEFGVPLDAEHIPTIPSSTVKDLTLSLGGDRYLLGWTDAGQLKRANISVSIGLTATVTIQDVNVVDAAVGADGPHPRQVFDATSRQALLVYRGADNALYARRLTNANTSDALPVQSSIPGNGVDVALCADPRNGGWIAAWTDPGAGQTFYQAIGPDGAIRGSAGSVARAEATLALACDDAAPLLDLEFDEASGADEFIDATGFQHNAACSGDACPVAGVEGRFGRAVRFNGSTQSLAIPNSADFNFGTDDDFTVSFWVKADANQPDTSRPDNDIVEKWDGIGGYPFVVRYSHSDGLIHAARYDGANQPTLSSAQLVNDGQFHHVAFVKNGEMLSLYIDGLLSGVPIIDTTKAATANASPLYLGMRGSGTNHFAGTLDRLQIFPRALSIQEIGGIFDATAAIYDLDEVSGSQIFLDSSGSDLWGHCSTSSSCPTMGVPGVAYSAAGFDGKDDVIQIDPKAQVVEIYRYDFETDVDHAAWSSTARVSYDDTGASYDNGAGGNYYLGNFGNQTVTLTLKELPLHDTVKAKFDMLAVDTSNQGWDGQRTDNGPDHWEWGYDDTALFHTNFSSRYQNTERWTGSLGTGGSVQDHYGNYQAYPGRSSDFATVDGSGVTLCQHRDRVDSNTFTPGEPCNEGGSIADYGFRKDVPDLNFAPKGVSYNPQWWTWAMPLHYVVRAYQGKNYTGSSSTLDIGRFGGSFATGRPYFPGTESLRIWPSAHDSGSGRTTFYDNGDANYSTEANVYTLDGIIEDHTAEEITLYFKGDTALQDPNGPEKWGLNNVEITLERDNTSIPLNDTSFTLSAWAKRTPNGADQWILTQGTNQANQGLQFGFYGSNRFVCGFWGDDLLSTATYADEAWHHWACVYDVGTKKRVLYRDGVEIAQDTATAVYSNIGPTYVGARFGTEGYFNGTIDEIGVWREALTADEVFELYRKVKAEDQSVMAAVLVSPQGNNASAAVDSLVLRETTTDLGAVVQTVDNVLTIDPDAPTISIDSVTDEQFVGDVASMVVGGIAQDPTSFVERVDVAAAGSPTAAANGTGTWSYAWRLSGLPEGRHSISATATDAVGNKSPTVSKSINIDRTAPETVLNQAEQTLLSPRNDQGRWLIPLSGGVHDGASGVALVEVLVDGTGTLAGQGWQQAPVTDGQWALDYVLPAFGDDGQSQVDPTGAYTVTVVATDRVSNTAVIEAGITLDAVGPAVTLSVPTTATTTITKTLELQGTVADASQVTTVEVDFTPAEQIDALLGSLVQLPFNEALATEYFEDQSGSDNSARCEAHACPRPEPNGRKDGAAAFDGVDDRLDTERSIVDLAKGDFTIAAWIKTTASSQGIVTKNDGDPEWETGEKSFYLDGSGKPRFVGFGNGYIIGTVPVNDGQWHHVVVVWSHGGGTGSARGKIYVDGVDATSPETAYVGTNADNPGDTLKIGEPNYRAAGSDVEAPNHFSGALDELLIYDRALADYEVANLYAYGQSAWRTATLDNGLWRYPIPAGENGIEGFFQLDVRGTDALGNRTPLSGQRLWRGIIDTRPPSVSAPVTVTTAGNRTIIVFDCNVTDFSVDNDGSCVADRGPLTFRPSDRALTMLSDVNPWYRNTITGTDQIAALTARRTYTQGNVLDDINITACDAFDHCSTVPTGVNAAAPGPMFASPGAPNSGDVLTSLTPIDISGHIYAPDGRGALAVRINHGPRFYESWQGSTPVDEPWSFRWTPPGPGVYTVETTLYDWSDMAPVTAAEEEALPETTNAGAGSALDLPGKTYLPLVYTTGLFRVYFPYLPTAIDESGSIRGLPRTIFVDLTAPTISLPPESLVAMNALGGNRTVRLRGQARDDTRLHSIEVRVGRAGWRQAVLDEDGNWHLFWTFDQLLDGELLPVDVRATDIAGRSTTVNDEVLVDLRPPQPGAVTLTYQDSQGVTHSMAPGDTLRDARTITVAWDAAAGNGPTQYAVGFTRSALYDPAQLTGYDEPGTHTQSVRPDERWYVTILYTDAAGNQSVYAAGPVFVGGDE